MRVWLDDVRPEPPGWLWVKTPKAAIELLKTGHVTEISLDHDLQLEHYRGENLEGTGYDVLTWLEMELGLGRWDHEIPVIHIHTRNPVGWKRMMLARERIRSVGRTL